MRLTLTIIIAILLQSLNIFGQTRTVTGKVIGEDLEVMPYVIIKNSDTVLLGTTDLDGKFVIEIPVTTKTLRFGWYGYEWKTINLPAECNHLDIILMEFVIYDYISLRKVNRLRMKRFEKLPELHSTAYKKGIFKSQLPCYEQTFEPFKPIARKVN